MSKFNPGDRVVCKTRSYLGAEVAGRTGTVVGPSSMYGAAVLRIKMHDSIEAIPHEVLMSPSNLRRLRPKQSKTEFVNVYEALEYESGRRHGTGMYTSRSQADEHARLHPELKRVAVLELIVIERHKV